MMWEALVITLVISTCCLLQTVTLGVLMWAVCQYFRARRKVAYILCMIQNLFSKTPRALTMEMDDLIDGLLLDAKASGLEETTNTPPPESKTTMTRYDASCQSVSQQHRERLAALAAGGQAKIYLGRALTSDQIDALDEDEVEKLYARYEARLGAAMTKTLGQAALQLYSGLAAMLLPIPPENQPGLVHDLEADPFVGHALSSATCELYHRYGMLLAPLTAALTTIKHCQFGQQRPSTIDNDGSITSGATGTTTNSRESHVDTTTSGGSGCERI